MAAPRPVALSLQEFPKHAAIIGDMLLGFADLEFFTVDLVGQAMDGHEGLTTSIRILYRLRGANDRLNVADAILQPFMDELGLKAAYDHWLGAMRTCKAIRNQYAHCAWSTDEGRLTFASMEEAAQPGDESALLEFKPIDLPLLEEQQSYFGYALDVTAYLMDEVRFRKDPAYGGPYSLPKSRAAPTMHSPLR
jgi:hypothetical protein